MYYVMKIRCVRMTRTHDYSYICSWLLFGIKHKVMRLRFKALIYIIVAIFAISMVSCSGTKQADGRKIVVTMAPLAGLVEEIVGEDYEVSILLPSGSTPENYSPTPRQIASLEGADMVFMLGTMDFEQQIVKRFENQRNNTFVDVSDGIKLMSGCCSHSHSHEHHDCDCEHHSHSEHAENHHIGTDPHIWLAPGTLEVIVDNIAEEILAQNPDSTKYSANYEQLKAKLQQRKEHYREALTTAPKAFLIYHPALGYLAEEYGLEQISLENEGKSPTPAALAEIVDRVKAEGIESMIYQQEYPLDVVQPIAEILGVNLVEINPLSKDIIAELDRIVGALTNNK